MTLEDRPVSLAELRAAREIFLTSASSFVKPIVTLDGAQIGDGAPGPVSAYVFGLIARRMNQ